ncbi:MAG: restriction endonuclease subunit S [Thermodesulfobacteriota bacterium]
MSITGTTEWPTRRLKFAATINDNVLSEETEPNYELQYLDIGNVDSSGDINEMASYRFENAPSRARRIVLDGDVIISTVRTYLQAITSIENPPENLIVSTGFAVIRPRTDVLDPQYCKYALREPSFLAEVEMGSVGVNYPAINATEIGNIRIHLPPLPLQNVIATFLDRETKHLDALVLAKQKLIDLLAERRRAVINSAVTQGLNPRARFRESGLSWIGQIPRHWQLERLKFHLRQIEQGWSPQCDNNPAGLDEWGVLKAGCVNGQEFDANENKRLPEDLEPLPEYEIRPGDVLMSRANTTQLVASIALVGNVRPHLLLCDKLYRLNVDESRLTKRFLVAFLGSSAGRFVFERDATGASNSMQNINQESVRNVWIPVPPVSEQHDIVGHIAAETTTLNTLQEVAERTIRLLKERRSSLISAAVTGRVDVSKGIN